MVTKNKLRPPISEKKEIKFILSLVKRFQYLEALDRYKKVLAKKPLILPDILNDLYKVLNQNDTNLQLKILISELYLSNGHLNESYIELEEIFEINPQFTQIYFSLSKLYKKKHNTKQIIAVFESALNKNILDSAIINTLPKVYNETNNYKKLIEFYEILLRDNPSNIKHKQLIGELYIQVKSYPKSISIFETLANEHPETIPQFIDHCTKIAHDRPDLKESHLLLIKLYKNLCHPIQTIPYIKTMVEKKLMDDKEVVKTLKDILSLFPNTSEIILYLAEVLIQQKNYTEGIENLQKICSQNTPIESIKKIKLL